MIEEGPRPPDPRERRALLEVLARAFRDNPMNRALHGPRPGRRLRANRAGLRGTVLDAPEAAEMRVIGHGGVVVGGWLATPPALRILPGPTLRRQIGCLWHQGTRVMQAWGEVSEALQAIRPLVPHWYLALLGVEPGHWGRGLGGRLLAALEARVAADPAPIYLECDRDESIRFYRSRGFEPLVEATVHGVRCVGLGRGFD